MTDLNVHVEHLTRVEGHGNIVVNAKNGEIIDARFDIVESPRFFEAMLLGRRWQEVHYITSRICGICAVGHTSTSLQGTEMALGIKISEQAHALRKIIFYGEQLQSHILHTYFLVAPDFVGAPSVIPLATAAPDVVKRALKLKKMANRICEVIAGRHVHPIGMVPGGFSRYPTVKELKELREYVLSHAKDIDETVNLFASLKAPEYWRETEFVSLKNPKEYAFYEGDIYSSDSKKSIPQVEVPRPHQGGVHPDLDLQALQGEQGLLHGGRAGAVQQQLRHAPPEGQTGRREAGHKARLLQYLPGQRRPGGRDGALLRGDHHGNR